MHYIIKGNVPSSAEQSITGPCHSGCPGSHTFPLDCMHRTLQLEAAVDPQVQPDLSMPMPGGAVSSQDWRLTSPLQETIRTARPQGTQWRTQHFSLPDTFVSEWATKETNRKKSRIKKTIAIFNELGAAKTNGTDFECFVHEKVFLLESNKMELRYQAASS